MADVAEQFTSFDELVAGAEAASFDAPPALVCNAHITGLGVARALAAHDVPVVALDRVGDGVAPPSTAVDLAGRVTYPLDDAGGFRADLERLAAALDDDPVAFGCMDEWVHALAATRPDGVRLPFAADRIDAVLDKTSLYETADRLGVPYPETYRVAETVDTAADGGLPAVSAETAVDTLGVPLVVKPARKRAFEEVVGTNVVEVENADELHELVETARRADVRVMAQERVSVRGGADRSYGSYVRPTGEAIGVVGAPTRYPATYGTSCLVERVEAPTVADRAREVLEATGYHGVSEAEFVYDDDRDEYVLLDVNTRPWKWIGLPVAAGVDLPYAAYADAVGESYEPAPATDATWVYLRDYLARLADGAPDRLTEAQWTALVAGAVDDDQTLTTGVYSPADPGPGYRLLRTEFGETDYYCAC